MYAIVDMGLDKYKDVKTEAVTEIKDKAVTVNPGDEVIVVCDKKDVVYVINVTDSDTTTKIDDLYADIKDDATVEPVETEIVAMTKKLNGYDPITAENLGDAKTALAAARQLTAINTTTKTEWDNLQNAIAALDGRIVAFDAQSDLATAKAAAKKLLDDNTADGGDWDGWTPGMIDAVEAWIDTQDLATLTADNVDARWLTLLWVSSRLRRP